MHGNVGPLAAPWAGAGVCAESRHEDAQSASGPEPVEFQPHSSMIMPRGTAACGYLRLTFYGPDHVDRARRSSGRVAWYSPEVLPGAAPSAAATPAPSDARTASTAGWPAMGVGLLLLVSGIRPTAARPRHPRREPRSDSTSVAAGSGPASSSSSAAVERVFVQWPRCRSGSAVSATCCAGLLACALGAGASHASSQAPAAACAPLRSAPSRT